MKIITKRIRITLLIIFSCFCINVTVNAQTPADDPGIGGPGAGVAPAGDGAPTVPFDGGMSLILAASGISFAYRKIRHN